jgi:uncharacterized membrane-anchored protein YjiN (DUF445 family)
MRGVDVAGAIGRFLERPPGEGRLREGASRLIVDILESLDQERLGGMVKSAVSSHMRSLEVSPLLGGALEAAITDERHLPILDGIITWAGRTLDANEDAIRAMVHDRTGLMIKLTGLDEKIADSIVDGLRRLTIDMAVDPYHPMRAKAEEGLAQLAWDMRYDPAMRDKVEAWKNQIIENKAVTEWVEGLWETARGGLLKAARDPDATMAGKFGDALRQLGETLQKDARLRKVVNQFARRVAVGAVARYGNNIVTLVSDTIRGWNTQTVTDRLEAAVGRDLQYIRVNGTLVGGLVGLAIHTLEVAG